MKRVVLVVLSRYPDLFKRFKEGLAEHEPAVSRLLVRDGRSIDLVPANCGLIDGADPFNYSRNVNMAWEVTAPADVILCGDDVEVKGEFVKTLQDTAYSDETVGVSTAQLWGQSPFVCGYFKRSVIKAVGPMDDRFTGYGLDDMDWCKRMEAVGYHTQPVLVPVEHAGGTSFYRAHAEQRINMPETNEANWEKFNAKWKK